MMAVWLCKVIATPGPCVLVTFRQEPSGPAESSAALGSIPRGVSSSAAKAAPWRAIHGGLSRQRVAIPLHWRSAHVRSIVMFDLVTGNTRHIPNHNTVPLLISSMAEAALITVA